MRGEVEDLIQVIREKYGKISGIIHAAGVIRDNFIIKKKMEEAEEVLSPKVKGLVNLDQASAGMRPEIFIMFSSITGVMGNAGQADYAAANGFMDAYARYSNEGVADNGENGRKISINWPLWKEGGMKIDTEIEKMMMKQTGMSAMETESGIKALYRIAAMGKNHVIVMEGDIDQINKKIISREITSELSNIDKGSYNLKKDDDELINKIQYDIVKKAQKIFSTDMGIDSKLWENHYE